MFNETRDGILNGDVTKHTHPHTHTQNPESTLHGCQLQDCSGEEWQKMAATDFFSMSKALNLKTTQDYFLTFSKSCKLSKT